MSSRTPRPENQSALLSTAQAIEHAHAVADDIKKLTYVAYTNNASDNAWCRKIYEDAVNLLNSANSSAAGYYNLATQSDFDIAFARRMNSDMRKLCDRAIRLQRSYNIRNIAYASKSADIGSDMLYIASVLFMHNYWTPVENRDVTNAIADKFRNKTYNRAVYYVAYNDGSYKLGHMSSDTKPELFIGCFATCIFDDKGESAVIGAVSDEAAYAKLCAGLCGDSSDDTKNVRAYTIAYASE